MDGETLKRRREALGVSQQAVAKAAGISWPMAVSLAERGKASPATARNARRGLVRLERRAGAGKRLAWPYGVSPPASVALARARAHMKAAAAIPRSPERDAYFCMLIERAWSLLDEADAESADLLCEFLPPKVGAAVIDQFFSTEDARPSWALDQLFNGDQS